MSSVEPTSEPAGSIAQRVSPSQPFLPLVTNVVGPIESADLFKGATEVRVRHRGDEYRLRITRQGKLILTK